MEKYNLIGLKEKLSEIRDINPGLQTPLVWKLPPFFADEMLKSVLVRVIYKKSAEIKDSTLEKVAIFLLECVVEYFLKTLLEDCNLEEKFRKTHSSIDTLKEDKLSEEELLALKEDLHFMVRSTEYVVTVLKCGNESFSDLPTKREYSSHFIGVEGWFNMVLYDYASALPLFDLISETPEYGPLYAFYHGKCMARERRQRNDRKVSELEVKLLLEGSHRHITLPCILQTFENAGLDSALVFKYKAQFNEILERAWDCRDAYHSANLTRLANLFLRRKEVAMARGLFELALKLDSKCRITLHKYGSFKYNEGQREEGIHLLIKANHIPAFMTAVKLSGQDEVESVSQLFDKVELIMTNGQILPQIRYIMYVYSLDTASLAKAMHHLKALYNDAKDTRFTMGNSESSLIGISRLFKLKSERIPDEVDINEECSRFRRLCKDFDSWLKQQESEKEEYKVFSIPM